jgi:hypothetical protein
MENPLKRPITLSIWVAKPVWLLLLCWLVSLSSVQGGPFPVVGKIVDGNDQPMGEARVYPRYVEIFDLQNNKLGKVGILVEKGIAKLFLVGHDEKYSLVGYATGGKLYNNQDKVVGSYFWTPTWSFIYNLKGVRAGKVKCIAWPRVCAVGVGGYLLNLFDLKNESSP